MKNWLRNVAKKAPAVGGAFLGHISGTDPHGMDPRTGPKTCSLTGDCSGPVKRSIKPLTYRTFVVLVLF